MHKVLSFIKADRFSIYGIITCLALMVLFVCGAFDTAAAQDTAATKRLEYSVSVSGDYAVVGAQWDDGYKGAAYVYKRDGDTWREIQKLSPGDLGRYDHFGRSVAIEGDVITVSAPWQDLLEGAVYRFVRDGDRWVQTEKNTGKPTLSEVASAAAGVRENDAISSDVLTVVERTRGEDRLPPLVSMETPPAPTNVQATNGTFEDRVEVSWDSVDLEAFFYLVYRGEDLISIVSSDETIYADTDPNVVPGTTYQYYVRVENSLGEQSAKASDPDGGGSRIIFRPSLVSASDGDYDAYVRVSWIDRSAIEAGFLITRDGADLYRTDPNTTGYRDSSATEGISYEYAVYAFDENDNRSDEGLEDPDNDADGFTGFILPPSNVVASFGLYTDRVKITWSDQAKNETGYVIRRNGNVQFTTGEGVKEYDDMTADPGTEYTYCVSALRGDGEESIEVCAQGGIDILPAPENVQATDFLYDDRVTITWEYPHTMHDWFEISRAGTPLDTVGAGVTLYNDRTGDANVEYNYCVKALSDDGGVSTAACEPGTKAIILAPTEVAATDGDYEDRVEITWKSSATTVALFKIYRDDVLIKTTDPGSRYYGDITGVSGREYNYEVEAVSALNIPSDRASSIGSRLLLAPTVVSASDDVQEHQVLIEWTDNSGKEDGYFVWRYDFVAADSVLIETTDPGGKSYADKEGEPGVRYRYSVRAYDDTNGETGMSTTASDNGRRTLIAPTNVWATKGDYEDRVEISWLDNSNAEDGYKIYCDGDSIGVTIDNTTIFEDDDPPLADPVEYQVIAFDAYGTSEPGTDSGFAQILAPVSVNASDSYTDRIELKWVDVSTENQGYQIYRDEYLIAELDDGDASSYTDGTSGNGVLVGSVDTYRAYDVFVHGSYAFVADYSSGLRVLDISDPTTPEIVASYDTPGLARGVHISGNHAFVADGGRLQVIDISDPEAPVGVGVYIEADINAMDVFVSGNYAYVANFNNGLLVLDITNPEVPIRLMKYYSSGTTWAVNISGSHAYLAKGTSGLEVLDITNPAAPAFAGSCDTPGNALCVAVSGDHAFVADWGGGVQVVNVSNPTNPYVVGAFETADNTNAIDVIGDYVIVGVQEAGIQVIDISNPTEPTFAWAYDTPGSVWGVTVAGDFIYTADYGSGVHLIGTNLLRTGVDYKYCVQAYTGNKTSEETCDNGTKISETETASTVLDMKLRASDAAKDDRFGCSVAVSGNAAIIGAVGDDIGSDNYDAGAAYVFKRNADGTWSQKQRITQSSRHKVDYFGRSVAMSGDVAIIGAHGRDINIIDFNGGSAYIFTPNENGVWEQKQEIFHGDRIKYDEFGTSVAIDGDMAIIGAPRKNASIGAAYIFTRSGGSWSQSEKLTAVQFEEGSRFGDAVAISGNVALVGSPYRTGAGSTPDVGEAYFFALNGNEWEQTQRIVSPIEEEDIRFGAGVALDGDVAAIAMPEKAQVYVYQRGFDGSWEQVHVLEALGSPDAVSINRGRILVGGEGYGGRRGMAYIFERNSSGTWVKTEALSAYDGAAVDFFGTSVALGDRDAFVGAHYNDDNGENSGSAYVLNLGPPGAVYASDGTFDSRVHVRWEGSSGDEEGFRIYRDGEEIDGIGAGITSYNDMEARPGQTYHYRVTEFSGEDELEIGSDFGWRPPDGNITGRVSTGEGAAVEGIEIRLDPPTTRALLFDGVGGHVRIDDDDSFDFSPNESFTIEAWVKYSGAGGSGASDAVIIGKRSVSTRFPFELRNNVSGGQPGQLVFSVSDGNELVPLESQRLDLNLDEWHHVACVYDPGAMEMRIFINGELDATRDIPGGLDAFANKDDVYFGYGPSGFFGGQLDEVRIWSSARIVDDIASAMRLQLTGEEDYLEAYWSLDEGAGMAVTDFTTEPQYGALSGGVYFTDNVPSLDVHPVTDMEGNYAVADIRYGEETIYQVRPFDGTRQFSPAFKTITLNTGNPVENQVNFLEISSYTVSGVVRLGDTGCPAADVEILLDNTRVAQTDKNGKFAISADNGWHTIRPVFQGHSFEPDSLKTKVTDDTSSVVFANTTRHTITGRVGGGCDRYVGTVTIDVRSETSCYAGTIETDGSYTIDLSPQKYFLKATVDEATIPPGLIKSDVIKFFETLGEREVDLTTAAEDSLHFIYRAPLSVEIVGFQDYIDPSCQLTFEGRDLPVVPVVPQFEVVTVTIKIDEVYAVDEDGNPVDTCPLDTGTVMIFDEIFDQEDTPVILPVSHGEAAYTTVATTPNLLVGRLDENRLDRSLQKAITVVAMAEGKLPVSEKEWVLVTGHMAPEGSEFLTFVEDPKPLYVLRDPPGDDSYAYLEDGYTSCKVESFDMDSWSIGTGLNLEVKWGWEKEILYGFGSGLIVETKYQLAVKNKLEFRWSHSFDEKTTICLSVNDRFSTSPSELFVGEQGDVFVGAGWNYLFTEVGVIELDGCNVVRTKAIGVQPDKIKTTFAFSRYHIESVLIPELEAKVDHFAEIDPKAAADYLGQAANWRQMLEDDDRRKRDAEWKENISFSAGADYEYSHVTDETISYVESHTFRIDNELSVGWEWDQMWSEGEISVLGLGHFENVYDYTDSTGTETVAVGYVLSDNDIGDNFTVDLKMDGELPSPVFDVLGGISSCPWEPWYDLESGEASTVARDNADIKIDNHILEGVDPDEPATFKLTLGNLSGSEEPREYYLRLLSTSNPGGAIVKANGSPDGITNGFSFFINPGQSQEVTMTVERGPTRYHYDSLLVALYPPCEFRIWEDRGNLLRADTTWFSVHFETACSDVTLYRPESGWTYSEADQDAGLMKEFLLTDYELQLGEADENKIVKSMGFQYRRLGDGDEGPDKWSEDITAIELGDTEPPQTTILWAPPPTLRDGVYEFRAFTVCDDGRGYSDIVTGTIDRHAPAVFGSPEPADEELSFGEDVSITFDEPIDQTSIITVPDSANVWLTYLDGTQEGDTIEAAAVCNGRTIVITPVVADAADLEGRRLEVTVSELRDGIGNEMPEAVTWQFDYRKSRFTWGKKNLTKDVAYRNPGTISAELVNGTGQPINFTIADLTVDWFDDVYPVTGTLAPGGKQVISLDVRKDLERDFYETQLAAYTEDADPGVAVLDINLTVSCHEPAWTFNPAKYEHTMTIVTRLSINDEFSIDTDDRVAAFVGGQLRGVANIETLPIPDPVTGTPQTYVALLTTYSNRVRGETLRFQVWDDEACWLYNNTFETFPFVSNDMVGSPDQPVVLTATEVLGDSVLTIPVNQGWTWISTNVRSVDMSVNGVLSDLTPQVNDMLKSRTQFSMFMDPTDGWDGSLLLLDNMSGYMIKLSEPGTILHTGTPVDTPVCVVQGWSWVSYLPQGPMPVATALADVKAQRYVKDYDMVKSQDAFAQYIGGQWYGNLEIMEPGKGYKLHLSAASFKPATDYFMYPPYDPNATASGGHEGIAHAPNTEGAPQWSVNPYAYQYNMTVTGVLKIDGWESVDGNDMIGAFVDDECRGFAWPIYVSGVNRHEAFLMVHSNEVAGEQLELRVFDAGTGLVYDVTERLNYEADGIKGTIQDPVVFNSGAVRDEPSGEDTPTVYALGQNHPNPFNPTTTIKFQMPAAGHVSLKIYNTLGQEVRTLENRNFTTGYHRTVWDAKDNSGNSVASGVYFYKLIAEGFTDVKKMVLLR